ncbi:MAG: glycosyltransferase family 4 protein [Alphaproteobacteria bacterium]
MAGRVCLVTSSFPRGMGDPTSPFVLRLARDLNDRGWIIAVLAPHAAGLNRHETLDGIPVSRFRYFWPLSQQTVCYRGGALFNLRREPTNWLKLPVLVVCQWLALLHMVRRHPCDVIHAHWILPQGIVALIVGRLCRVPVVITVHGSDVFALRGRLWAWFKRMALHRAAAITVNSSATEAAVRAIAPGLHTLHRIPMGVARIRNPASGREDLRAMLHLGDGPVLVFVGRLVTQKGVADLLRALAILIAEWPSACAVIVGDGPERAQLEMDARDLKIEERVRFVGLVDPARVPEYLAAADVFVAPARATAEGVAEGQGLAVIEAMLAGIPVVASRSGGLVDAVRQDETGLLVDEGTPAQIAAAVARLLRDRDFAGRLAARARDMAMETYSADVAADAFSRLFVEVTATGPAGPSTHTS